MSKYLLALLAAWCLGGTVQAQGALFSDTALRPTATIAGASVRVCTEAGVGTPCTPLASIYTDKALTQLDADSTIVADAKGNFSFYAVTGCYVWQISAPGFTTLTQTVCENSGTTGLSGYFEPGTVTGTVTAPATAPTVATDSTSGGSLDNTTRYIAIALLTLNGETTRSPVTTFTPSTCAGGTCKLSVNVAGNEWREGAFGYRVYACTAADGVTCYRQTGFPEELDTTGTLANVHYSPGTVILSTVTLSGTAPPSANTATIDADQVALNAACNDSSGFPRCYGTLQYRNNTTAALAQTGTTPLVVAWPASIKGHAVSSVDDTQSGSTRSCTFAHVKLGCVMVMNASGVNISGLHVSSASNGYMLTTWASSFNQVEIGEATVKTTGTLPVAPLRLRGIWYYLRFPNLQLSAGATGTGVNKGAGVLVSNAAGANWEFSGPIRWTVYDHSDGVRNDKGKTDPDRGNSTAFPTMVGEFKLRNVQFQWSPSGTGQGQLIRGENLVLQMNGVTHSDYNPIAGTGPLIEIGSDADGAAACCTSLHITDSVFLPADADNASWIKLVSNSGNAVQSLFLRNIRTMGVLDMNSLSLSTLNIEASDNQICNPNSTGARIINMTATQSLTCSYAASNGVQERRVSNYRLVGSLDLSSDGMNTNHRHFYWTGSDDLNFTRGANPETAADKIWQSTGSKQFNFFDFAGTGTRFRIDARSGVDIVQTFGTHGIDTLALDAANRDVVLTRAGANILQLATGDLFQPQTASQDLGTTSLRWDVFGAETNSTVFISATANVAATGQFRLAQADSIKQRNNANSADINILSASADVVSIGTTNSAGVKLGDNANTAAVRGILTATATLDFSNVAAIGCSTDLTITVTGAASGDSVQIGVPAGSVPNGTSWFFGWVSAADTVTIRHCNLVSGDPASGTFRATVSKF